jgi:DNA-binding NarL/FixJ family response regulator
MHHGMSQTFRVMLADDNAIVRQGLLKLFESAPDIEVVGQACNGAEAVELAKRLRPDVILMDINMPKMNGIEATAVISSELPGIRIIGLSLFESMDMDKTMRRAGAACYLSKSAPAEQLFSAIRTARPASGAA